MRVYLCIDLKSFYASVECVDLGFDPMTTDLVVADPDRGKGTICLAVSPSLKSKGVKNRCRVFEIPEGMNYFMAPPRMQLYIDYSARIYNIYLKYVSVDDIHVYSIDECFLDVTGYLKMYGMRAKELAKMIMEDIYETTGLISTCGIGTNLYLTKVALDIISKHSPDRIGCLTEELYQKYLWKHQPLTDFWMIGPGKARRLANAYIYTMGDIARWAQFNEEWFYKTFGIDAEILIAHAWGYDPVTMADIKNYKSTDKSLSTGQVLPRPYNYTQARNVFSEMTDSLLTDMFAKAVIAPRFSWWVSYDHKSMEECPDYKGPVYPDFYGRLHPVRSNGTVRMPEPTNSVCMASPLLLEAFDAHTDHRLLYRRLGICAEDLSAHNEYYQHSFFVDYEALAREKQLQEALYKIRSKFGANAMFLGKNMSEGATALERNTQIGGHKA